MTFDTAFERSHAPNTMNAEKDKAPKRPKRVWITWDDAYPWPTPEMGGDEYVHIDLLATARKEGFNDAIGVARSVILPPSLREARTQIVTALEQAAATDKDSTEKG